MWNILFLSDYGDTLTIYYIESFEKLQTGSEMTSLPPTDKTGRCYGESFSSNPAYEEIRSLLREGDALDDVPFDTISRNSLDPTGGTLSDSSSNEPLVGAVGGEVSRDRALRVLRRDLESSKGSERQDRPGRPEPYRTAKRLRQIGRIRSLDESSLGGSEASGGPSSPLSGGGLSSSSRNDSLAELNIASGGADLQMRCPSVFSDEDAEDSKSYGDSSTTSSSFFSASLYDKNKVPSILVSGTNESVNAKYTSELTADSNLAGDMDKEYSGSTAVHMPHYAGELISHLNVMKESGDLVNTKIHVGGVIISGHKPLLAAGSPYLASIMEGHSNSSGSKSIELEIMDVKPDMIGQVTDFIYTGKIGISSQNAQELLQQAYNKKLFLGKSVELACSEYLMGQFTTEGGSETSSTTGMASSVFSAEEDTQAASESIFHDRNYSLDILYSLNKQRQQKQFTDLVLKVEGKDFYCHRAILIAISPYFRAMLTSDMKESIEEEVTLHDLNAENFKRLLDFVYTCRLYLNDENAQEIMELACFLQLLPAISACGLYLKDQLATSNCLGILNFAYMYSCSELYDDATNFALEHFSEVITSDEYQDLQPVILSGLIADDRLNVRKEESVYQAVMLWLRYDIEERLAQLPSVLIHVRLPLINPEYYRKVVEAEPLLQQSEECKEIVQAAFKLREISGKGKHLNDIRLKLRFSMKTQVQTTIYL